MLLKSVSIPLTGQVLPNRIMCTPVLQDTLHIPVALPLSVPNVTKHGLQRNDQNIPSLHAPTLIVQAKAQTDSST